MATGAFRTSRTFFADGVSRRGAVYGPMAEVIYNSLQYLDDEDIRAMAVYLKSLAQGSRRRRPATLVADLRRAACCSALGKTDL